MIRVQQHATRSQCTPRVRERPVEVVARQPVQRGRGAHDVDLTHRHVAEPPGIRHVALDDVDTARNDSDFATLIGTIPI